MPRQQHQTTQIVQSNIALPAFFLQPQSQVQQQPHQQQRWQQQQCWQLIAGPLRFTTGIVGSVALPFARLAGTFQLTAPQELFSLSRLSSSDWTESSAGSSSDSSGSTNGYASGSEGDTDTRFGSDLHLDRINCQVCKRPLNQRPGKRSLLRLPFGRGDGSSKKKEGPSTDFLVCDCCQRCYHKHCCKQKGMSTKERHGVWFHDAGCRECQQQLQDKAAAGPNRLSGGLTWQLVDCAPINPQGPGGVKALQALKQHMSDVLDVMLPAFGPGAAQQLVDTTKGYAVLLKQGSAPLTAGLLDVYGQELAVLDLVATAVESRGQGHCRTLLRALEGWLGPELGVARLVAVCPADDPHTIQLWRQKFGFKSLDGKALKALQSSVPALNFYEESTMLSKPLKQPRGSTSSSNKQQNLSSSAADGHGGGKEEGEEAQVQQQGGDSRLLVEPLQP